MGIGKGILQYGLIAAFFCVVTQGSALATSRGLSVNLRASELANAPITATVKLYSKSYALVIGIDKYVRGWPRLSNAVKDARLVAQELEKHGFEVQFEKNLNSEDMKGVLQNFFIDKGSDPNARLFVWYAGHGHSERGNGYLVPADGPLPQQDSKDFRRTAISMRELGSMMREADAKHVMAVFDSCFAGTVFDAARSAPPPAITRVTTEPVREFLTSGDAGQTVSDDGKFRRLFIEALQGKRSADANHDGYLTASEMGLYLTDSVSNYTHNKQTPRYGKLRDPDFDRGDFVFKLASLGTTQAASFAPVAASGMSAEIVFWQSISNSHQRSDYAAYLKQFPNGTFAPLARNRMKELQTASLSPQAPTYRIDGMDAAYVAVKTANLRAQPDARSGKIGQVAADSLVMVTGKIRGQQWYRIAYAGKEAFVYAPLVEPADAGEIHAWGRVKNSREATDFKNFLRTYPSGYFSDRAKKLKAALMPRQVAVVTPRLSTPASSNVHPAGGGSNAGEVFRDCAGCPEMVIIPPGSFRMGDLNGGGDSDEQPVHRVTINYSFAVGKTEVTQAQWRAVMGNAPSYFTGDNRPVEQVSWNDTQDFLNKLNATLGLTGRADRFRLLSESEWEYVARAGTTTTYSWGNDIGRNNANCDGCGSRWDNEETSPVGSFAPNPFGLYDLHGNVWEWVEDCYADSYGGAPSDGGARTGQNSCYRVLRGGSWSNNPGLLRSANRSRYTPDFRNVNSGFRLARTL